MICNDFVYLASLLFKQSVYNYNIVLVMYICISLNAHGVMLVFVRKPPQPTEFYGKIVLGYSLVVYTLS